MKTFYKMFFAILTWLLISSSAFAQLSGTYTINAGSAASATNYKSFTAAVGDLVTGKRTDGGPASGKGVKGAVVFNVAKGTYTEQIDITAISGASASNTITFQSANGDSTSVTLTYNAPGNSMYVLYLKGASFIRINQITIEHNPGSSSYCGVLRLDNGSHNNIFSNNRFVGVYKSQVAYGNALVGSYNDDDTGNVYINNHFLNGGYGMYMNGTGYLESGTRIENNTFDSMGCAMVLDSQRGLIVKGNTMNIINAPYCQGMHMEYNLGGTRIEGNKIYLHQDGVGILAWLAFMGTSSKPAYINNNFISIGNGNYMYGIFSLYGTYQNYYNNNIHMYGLDLGGLTGNAVTLYGTTTQATFYNNNLVCTGGGMAISSASSSLIAASDYNNLYSTGAVLCGTSFGHSSATLADWQAVSGLDSHSVSVDPVFYGNLNLHTRSGFINGKGIPLAQIKLDIDGQVRDPKSPDIGADEFTPAKLDAGIAKADSPSSVYCNKQVIVRIMNYGTDTLKSLKIGWLVNGVSQTPYAWSGTLVPGSISAAIKIGSYSFVSPNTYSLKVYTYNPNGGTDGLALNDTLFQSSLTAGMNGTYTIGGTSPDYATFGKAVKDLLAKGVCGAVIFNARDGIYKEKILLTKIPGASSSNTVTFQSASADSSKVILSAPASATDYYGDYAVFLNNASFLRFRNLKLERSGTSTATFGRVVRIEGGSCNNIFYHNFITGVKSYRAPDGTSYNSAQSLVWSEYGITLDSGNQFIGNHLKYGSNGFYYVGFWKNGTLVPERGTVIEGNIIDSSVGCPLLMAFQEGAKVRDNKINWAGFVNNYGFHGAGLYFQSCSNVEITGNYVDMAEGGNGVECFLPEGKDTTLVANNFIRIGGHNSHSMVSNGIAAYYGTARINIYDNNVNIDNTNGNGCYLQGAFRSYRLFGNSLVNIGGGYALGINSGSLDSSDFNNLLTSGKNLCFYNTTNAITLADWQSLSGLDSNSFSADPLYTSVTDLHVHSPVLNGAGIKLSGITVDFDKEKRGKKTDMGADEFTPPALDAGIMQIDTPNPGICAGSNRVAIRIMNYGSDTLTSLKIGWSVNGTAQTTYAWTGKLSPGKVASISPGTYGFSSGSSYDLEFYIYSPNGKVDENLLNDTIVKSGITDALSGTYTIGGSSPDYSDFKSAVSDLLKKGICGSVVFNVRDGVYSEQISLSAVPGASSVNTIVFQSQSGDSSKVKLTSGSSSGSSKNYTLELNGASWITFRKMTLARTGSGTYGTVIEVHGGATHNTISNNRIAGVSTSTDNQSQAVIHSAQDIDSFIQITDNRIVGGASGMYWYGTGQVVAEPGTMISRNQFDSNGTNGIFMGFQDAPLISENRITNIKNSPYHAIELYDACINGIKIIKNYINLPNGGYGIYSDQGISGSINDSALIANNSICINGIGWGFYAFAASYANIYNNSFSVTSTSTYSLGAFLSLTSTLRVYNNNFIMKGPGNAIHTYSIGTNAADMDYNNYYSSGGSMGNQAGIICNTISDWQSATGMESHSISADPGFKSKTDLHVTKSILSRKGLTMASVPDDMDGDVRKAVNCDIGADEFPPLKDDLSALSLVTPGRIDCGDSFTRFAIVIYNPGNDTQTNFPVKLIINGTTTLNATYSKSLASGNRDTVWFSTAVNTSKGGKFTIMGRTALSGDMDTSNDIFYDTLNIAPSPKLLYAKGADICKAGSAFLHAKGVNNENIYWYDSASSTAPVIAIGDSFPATIKSGTKTFYVSAANARAFLEGASNNTFPSSAFSSETEGLVFDAALDLRIDSLTIYPDVSGLVWIELWDPSGNVLAMDSFSVVVTSKYQKVRVGLIDLLTGKAGFNIPAGKGYQLVYDGSNSSSRLLMNTIAFSSKLHYPFKKKDGLVTVIHSVVTNAYTYNTSVYYYFYDWKVSAPSCTTSKVPVTLRVNPLSDSAWVVTNFDTLNKTVRFSPRDSAASSNTYLWKFGDSGSSVLKQPWHTYSQRKKYNVELKITNASGCTTSFSDFLLVDTVTYTSVNSIAAKNMDIRVSPNPCMDNCTVYFNTETVLKGSAAIFSMDGKEMFHTSRKEFMKGGNSISLDMKDLSAGIYLLKITIGDQIIMQQVSKL